MLYAVIALTVVGIVETVVLWAAVRGLSRLDHVEARLQQLTDALTLLTETAESGFRASAQEISRMADQAAANPTAVARTTTRRIVRAAKEGRTPAEIAAEEQKSEGEVRLRLLLADTPGTKRPGRSKENPNAPLRP